MASKYLAEIFAKNLQKALEKRNMNQRDFGKLAEIDETQLGRYLKGKHLPNLKQIGKIAGALGTRIGELLDDPAESPPPLPIEILPDISSLIETVRSQSEIILRLQVENEGLRGKKKPGIVIDGHAKDLKKNA